MCVLQNELKDFFVRNPLLLKLDYTTGETRQNNTIPCIKKSIWVMLILGVFLKCFIRNVQNISLLYQFFR